uniref:CSON005998 protein n=1 Tax=Culicoides sonorensis TaxID=179676 RepID=A0A336LMZ6_CULSO
MEKDENQSDCENKTEMRAENNLDEDSSDEDDESVADTSEASESDVSESRPSCPICLRSFSCQQIGFPEDCSSVQHIFCALCIEEWAKNVTTCPIDRKEFTKICIMDNWLDKNVIRSVEVTRKEYNEAELEAVDDLTYCEICHRSDNEHTMLLCDGCDHGFHMECLTPRLREVPLGSWYCRRCITSRESAANEAAVEEEIESSAESDAPLMRVIRTRASERIRAAIITRGDLLESDSQDEEETPAQPQAGPSRIRSTLERVRRALKRGTRKRRRRRATRRTTRTAVEEYDVNSGDEKFPIKRSSRTGRVIKRKRKTKKRRTKKKSQKNTCKFSISRDNNDAGINAMRYNSGIPTVRLFEPANNLDYFSDEENDEMPIEPTPVHRIPATGDVLTAIRMNNRIGANRNLLKRKMIIEPIHHSSANILDSIMESQEKWHSKNGLSNVCTLKGGKPVFNNNNNKKGISPNNRPEINQAPLNGTTNNGTSAFSGGQQQNYSTRNENQRNQNAVDGTETRETNNSSNTSNVSGAQDGSGENTGRTVVNTFSALPQRPQKTAASRKSFDIFGDDEDKSCPNFSVYSSESMNLAKNKEKVNDSENEGDQIDERVDLVQLSGDDEDEENNENQDKKIEDEKIDEAQSEQMASNEDKPISDSQAKSQVLHLYDSDGGLDEEINKHLEGQGEQENPTTFQAPDRSYTPCLDEKYPTKEGEDATDSGKTTAGIDGMETELISEDEDSSLSARGADKTGNNKEQSDKQGNKESTTPFKKVQNQRERNYREKDKNKRRHSRDKSEDKENKSKKISNKKREIPRYNVREVITKASQRDPFGRTKPRERSRSRSPAPRRRTRSRTRSPISRSSKSRSWSRKSFSISRSPSYSPRRNKRTKSKSPSPKRQMRTKSPIRRAPRTMSSRKSFSRSPSRSMGHRSKSPLRRTSPVKRKDRERKRKRNRSRERKKRPVSRSPVVEPVVPWTNPSQIRRTSITRHPSPSWTPPLGTLKGSQENLRVVLQNRDVPATSNRTKKKDKKKKAEKKKSKDRREHRHRHEKIIENTGKSRTVPTSKEVFASGDNILVSVSFSNTNADKQPTQPDADREVRRVERDPTKTLQLKDPIPPKPTRKHRKIDTKPVAFIDLDNSPFNEAPASPVIVLSDSDHERDGKERRQGSVVEEDQVEDAEPIDECVRPASPPESPNAEEDFRIQATSGPKTPPEPTTTSIKFTMPSKTRLRVINNLFEDDDEDENVPTRNDKDQTAAQKIGPNTPPDPTPKSPDVYDPFEPTKSPSESPGQQDNTMDHDDGPLSRSSTPPLEETQLQQQQQMLKDQEKMNQLKPVDLVMSLVNKSIGSVSEKEKSGLTIDSIDEITETHMENDVPVEKQITVLSNVVVQTPSKYNVKSTSRIQPGSTPLKTPTRSPAVGYKSQNVSNSQKLGIKPLSSLTANTSGSIISKLPLPRTTSNKSHGSAGMNDMEIDSPYSPGSNDFDDLFEPPSSTTDNYKPSTHSKNVTSTTRGGVPPNKADLFDNLFGSASPVHKFSNVSSTYKMAGKSGRSKNRKGTGKRSKFDDDEVPSSAVELQVKDKLLRKLNRQERVIEEVKLVIKPHYNKKRITKEEYKEIMRKAVPKICHSRTGEINPVKIQALVEAYVKKVRQRRKMSNKMQTA